jgi:hypothetical protein
VAQAAAEMSRRLGKPFGFIDFRLAQCEVGDLIGMPRYIEAGEVIQSVFKDGVRTEQKRAVKQITIHDLAEWFPTDPDSCGFLFLDELPRAPRDVQNAVLELALDYRYHFRELPIGWRVVSAANADMDVYSGTQLDPALYDRFLKIEFRPKHPEWMAYAESIGVHPAITSYIAKNVPDLGLEIKHEPGKCKPTPRSWVKLSDVLKYMSENGDDPFRDNVYLTLLSKGYLGDVGLAFADYVKNNFKIYAPEDILDKFDDAMEKDFKEMLVTEIDFYKKSVTKYVKDSKENLSKKQGENLLRFLKCLPLEAATGFWSYFSAECRDAAAAWYKMESVVKGKKVCPVQEYVFGFLNKKKAMEEK